MRTSHFDMQNIYKKTCTQGCNIVRLVHLWHQQGHLKVKLASSFFFFLHGMHGCEEYGTCVSLVSLP